MQDAAAVQPARAPASSFGPIFAPLLARRGWCAYLSSIGIIHLVLRTLGFPGLGCIFRQCTGLPCPGCGLSHACLDLLRGDWSAAFLAHAFAPIFLAGLALLAAAAVLPGRVRARLTDRIAAFERRTGAVPLLFLALFVYWWARLP